jgi:hypothetical protein
MFVEFTVLPDHEALLACQPPKGRIGSDCRLLPVCDGDDLLTMIQVETFDGDRRTEHRRLERHCQVLIDHREAARDLLDVDRHSGTVAWWRLIALAQTIYEAVADVGVSTKNRPAARQEAGGFEPTFRDSVRSALGDDRGLADRSLTDRSLTDRSLADHGGRGRGLAADWANAPAAGPPQTPDPTGDQ